MISKQHLPQMDDNELDTYEYIQRYHEEQARHEYEKYRASNIEGDLTSLPYCQYNNINLFLVYDLFW